MQLAKVPHAYCHGSSDHSDGSKLYGQTCQIPVLGGIVFIAVIAPYRWKRGTRPQPRTFRLSEKTGRFTKGRFCHWDPRPLCCKTPRPIEFGFFVRTKSAHSKTACFLSKAERVGVELSCRPIWRTTGVCKSPCQPGGLQNIILGDPPLLTISSGFGAFGGRNL